MYQWIREALKLRMPVLGHEDTWFLGSGVVGISGSSGGRVDFAIGPDLTSPDYLKEEVLKIDGEEIRFDIYRLRGIGLFFGITRMNGLELTITEASIPNDLRILRFVTIQNLSDEEKTLEFRAEMVPAFEGSVQKDCLILSAPEGVWCFGNSETKNWERRSLRVRTSEGVTGTDGERMRLSVSLKLPPDEIRGIPLWHSFAYGYTFSEDPADPLEYIKEAARGWRDWLNDGEYPGGIRSPRLRDTVESLLMNIKMQQNRDGGMIAGIRRYANSYIRDTHGAARLLGICGHTREIELLLRNIHHTWKVSGYIPNWWSMGSDTFIGDSFHNGCSEITAYYIFMARDYLEYGGERKVVEDIRDSLYWAAGVQVQYLTAHGYLMDFNGDETEQYCPFRDGDTYGPFGHRGAYNALDFKSEAFSYSATLAAAVSLEYSARLWGEESFRTAAERVRERIPEKMWDAERGRFGWILDENGIRDTLLTNYAFMSVWMDKRAVPDARAERTVAEALSTRDPVTGYIPLCPGKVEGFCGHTMGLALYAALRTGRFEEADMLAETILHSNLLGRYGTVSEFYGPGGVPNGHNARPFEGGILGEALVLYAQRQRNEWNEGEKTDV